MTDTAPISQRDDGAVVISGEALPLVYTALFALRLRQHRDGIASTPLLQEAIRVLYRACVSRSRHDLADPDSPGSCCGRQRGDDLIGIAEAADLLGVSRRQTQRLAANGLDGVRCASTCGRRATSSGKPCKVRVPSGATAALVTPRSTPRGLTHDRTRSQAYRPGPCA